MSVLVDIAAPRSLIGFCVRLLCLMALVWGVYVVQELAFSGVPDGGWITKARPFCITAVPFMAAMLALLGHLRTLQDRLHDMAHTDTLTGLPNRRGFVERAGPAIGRGDVLLALDIDHFKRINDTHGHEAGDRALVRVADALRAQLRDDDLVARLGGEEFVVLLRDLPLDAARAVADRIARGIDVDLAPGLSETLTLSVGLTERVNAIDLPEALRQADLALYRAKADGRARAVVWTPRLTPAIG